MEHSAEIWSFLYIYYRNVGFWADFSQCYHRKKIQACFQAFVNVNLCRYLHRLAVTKTGTWLDLYLFDHLEKYPLDTVIMQEQNLPKNQHFYIISIEMTRFGQNAPHHPLHRYKGAKKSELISK